MTNLTTTQQVKVGPITATDRRGNPAPVENITATSLDEGVVVVVDDPDSEDNSILVKATGNPGTAKVQIVGDALIGDGEVPILIEIEFVVTGALAGKLIAPVGDPTEQPELG